MLEIKSAGGESEAATSAMLNARGCVVTTLATPAASAATHVVYARRGQRARWHKFGTATTAEKAAQLARTAYYRTDAGEMRKAETSVIEFTREEDAPDDFWEGQRGRLVEVRRKEMECAERAAAIRVALPGTMTGAYFYLSNQPNGGRRHRRRRSQRCNPA